MVFHVSVLYVCDRVQVFKSPQRKVVPLCCKYLFYHITLIGKDFFKILYNSHLPLMKRIHAFPVFNCVYNALSG